jgi:TetR/AcrR family transcriptional regulator, transcriptional repressor for nem operon
MQARALVRGATDLLYRLSNRDAVLRANKRDRALEQRAATINSTAADWIADQFRQLGHRDAPELAMTMLSTVEGAAVLTNTLRDPSVMTSQIRRLQRRIDSLADSDK